MAEATRTRFLRTLGILVPTGFVVLVLLACKESGGAGSACKGDRDCKNGYLCESEVCLDAKKAELIRREEAKPPAPETSPGSPVVPARVAPQAAAPGESPPTRPAAPGPEQLYAGIGERSSPPTTAEWNAVTKEIDVRYSTPLRCETKFLREWLRVSCRGETIRGLSVIKREGVIAGEVMTYAKAGSVASLVMPIRGSLEVVVTYTWSTIGTRTLTVRYAAGTKVPDIYFDAPP